MHYSVPIRFSFLFKPTLHLTLALLTLVLLYYTECIDLKFGKVQKILHKDGRNLKRLIESNEAEYINCDF